MTDFYNYKSALLYLFIKCMGDGFYEEMCKYGNIQKSNLKHKISEMNNYNKSAYREISYILQNCISAFTEGEISDKETLYCQKNASDKYYYTFGFFFDKFKWACNENDVFFYEDFSDVLSYIISKEFYTDLDKYNFSSNSNERNEFLKENESLKNDDLEKERKFRPEYKTAVFEVRFNAKDNATFYKWCIDDFYKDIADKNKADEIIKMLFGKNEDDYSISTTFEKLKYEKGKREWRTFRKLFQNELNNKELMELLSDEESLGKYQIFQTRMSAAFFLENLCAALPDFTDKEGKINSNDIRQILIFNKSCKKPEAFLLPEHKDKTDAYKNKINELLNNSNSYENFSDKLDTLDKNCPATETVKAYLTLQNSGFYYYLEQGFISNDSFEKNLEICKQNPRFLEYFANIAVQISNSHYCITSDLNGFLWIPEYPI